MKYRVFILGVCILMLSIILEEYTVFCQQTEEKEEKTFDLLKLHRLLLPYKFSPRLGVFSGFDSNVNLSRIRKGDVFEEFLLSLSFSKPWLENIKWSEGIKFTFNYDLDVLNYNEITDASNILNHFTFGLHKRYAPFLVGCGYDLGILYYPHNEDGDFLLHKGFLYLRQNLLRKLYHQVRFEAGYKQYTNREALADTLSTHQDDKRHDYRYSLEYAIGAPLSPRLFLKGSGKYSRNESNARYVDFYDYNTTEAALSADCKLLDALFLFSKFSYLWRNYGRYVTLRDYKQKDRLYTLTTGITYQLTKHNSLSLYYTYRENSSNDSLEEYFEHLFTSGWQYSF